MSQYTSNSGNDTLFLDRLFSHRRNGRAMTFLCAPNGAAFCELLRILHRSHLGHNTFGGTCNGKQAHCLVAWTGDTNKVQELRDLATYWAQRHGQSRLLFVNATGRVQMLSVAGKDAGGADAGRASLSRKTLEAYFTAASNRVFNLESVGENVFPHYGSFASRAFCHAWDMRYARLGRDAFAQADRDNGKPETGASAAPAAPAGLTSGARPGRCKGGSMGDGRREGSLADVLEHGSTSFVFATPDGHRYQLSVLALRKPGGAVAQDEFTIDLWRRATPLATRRTWKRCALSFEQVAELAAQCQAGDISVGRLARELDNSWGSHANYLAERKRLEPLAARGDREATYRLSSLIRQHAPEDRAWVDYLRTSAREHGNAAAQFRLARAYEKGDIKDSSVTQRDILSLYRKAARQGNARALRKLGKK